MQQMTDQMTRLVRTPSDWMQAESRPLLEIEAQVVRTLHDLGNSLLAALTPHAASARPAPDVACACGQTARSLRMRLAAVITVLRRVTLERAIDRCPPCGTYQAPLDVQLQIAPGSFSPGLHELLALLGAAQDSFAQAAIVLERLCLVQVCPNRVRAAPEDLGAALADHDQQIVTTAPATGTLLPAEQDAPSRVDLSMDGVVAHVHDVGWKEITVGCGSTTRTRTPRQRPETLVIHDSALLRR